MTSTLVREQAQKYVRKIPDIKPGYTVRIHERIQEGEKERTQPFEGLVISVHRGMTPTDSMFTIRRVVGGVGVEKVLPLHSPNLAKIEVKKVAKVRRAKLTFLRGRHGKGARLSERFTTAEEFNVAVAPEEVKAEEKEVVGEEVKESKEEEEAKEREKDKS